MSAKIYNFAEEKIKRESPELIFSPYGITTVGEVTEEPYWCDFGDNEQYDDLVNMSVADYEEQTGQMTTKALDKLLEDIGANVHKDK